jgi:hypothetical protein
MIHGERRRSSERGRERSRSLKIKHLMSFERTARMTSQQPGLTSTRAQRRSERLIICARAWKGCRSYCAFCGDPL